jgi:hypothetical protein
MKPTEENLRIIECSPIPTQETKYIEDTSREKLQQHQSQAKIQLLIDSRQLRPSIKKMIFYRTIF